MINCEHTLGVMYWAGVAARFTRQAADTKDWRLRRKHDRKMKEIAKALTEGRGYIIATDKELAQIYPGLFRGTTGEESKRMIWAVYFSQFAIGDKMSFVPIR